MTVRQRVWVRVRGRVKNGGEGEGECEGDGRVKSGGEGEGENEG